MVLARLRKNIWAPVLLCLFPAAAGAQCVYTKCSNATGCVQSVPFPTSGSCKSDRANFLSTVCPGVSGCTATACSCVGVPAEFEGLPFGSEVFLGPGGGPTPALAIPGGFLGLGAASVTGPEQGAAFLQGHHSTALADWERSVVERWQAQLDRLRYCRSHPTDHACGSIIVPGKLAGRAEKAAKRLAGKGPELRVTSAFGALRPGTVPETATAYEDLYLEEQRDVWSGTPEVFLSAGATEPAPTTPTVLFALVKAELAAAAESARKAEQAAAAAAAAAAKDIEAKSAIVRKATAERAAAEERASAARKTASEKAAAAEQAAAVKAAAEAGSTPLTKAASDLAAAEKEAAEAASAVDKAAAALTAAQKAAATAAGKAKKAQAAAEGPEADDLVQDEADLAVEEADLAAREAAQAEQAAKLAGSRRDAAAQALAQARSAEASARAGVNSADIAAKSAAAERAAAEKSAAEQAALTAEQVLLEKKTVELAALEAAQAAATQAEADKSAAAAGGQAASSLSSAMNSPKELATVAGAVSDPPVALPQGVQLTLPALPGVEARWVVAPDPKARAGAGLPRYEIDDRGEPLTGLPKNILDFIRLDDGNLLGCTGDALGRLTLKTGAFESVLDLPADNCRLGSASGGGALLVLRNAAAGKDRVYRLRYRQLRQGAVEVAALAHVPGKAAAVIADGALTYIAVGRTVWKLRGATAERIFVHDRDDVRDLALLSGGGLFFATDAAVGFIGKERPFEFLGAPGARLRVRQDTLYIQLPASGAVMRIAKAPEFARFKAPSRP